MTLRRGRAIALRLAQDGYDICVSDTAANASASQEVVGEILAMRRKACTAAADVSDLPQVEEMIQASVRELGPLDAMSVLVWFCAGVVKLTGQGRERRHRAGQAAAGCHPGGLPAHVRGEHVWDAQLLLGCREANHFPGHSRARPSCQAHQRCVRRCLPTVYHALSLRKLQGTLHPPWGVGFADGRLQWAVRGLNQGYALELAGHNITCNAYAPGIVGMPSWRSPSDNC